LIPSSIPELIVAAAPIVNNIKADPLPVAATITEAPRVARPPINNTFLNVASFFGYFFMFFKLSIFTD